MTKGKPWTVEEEKQLRELFKAKRSLEDIAAETKKSVEAVRQKIIKLGLVEQQKKIFCSSSSPLKLPKELPSIEEALKILMGALNDLRQPDISKSEVSRLKSIIQAVKIYKELFADYVDYRGHELEMIEMRKRLAALEEVSKGDEAN